VRAFERSLAAASERSSFRVVHYSLQGNHAHFIVEARDRAALGRGMNSIATRLAQTVNRVFGRCGRVLAERYHLRCLRSPRQVRNAVAYVLLNARKHLAERVARLPHATRPDPASSGRWFDGWRDWLPEERSEEPACVAFPRSWLLRVGWRRHGLVDLSEVPGRSAAPQI
jgi:REP element-mobilizing transposase RayT